MPTVAETLARAQEQHRLGQLPEAERLYRLVLAAQPNHAELLTVLASVLGMQNKLADAETCLRRALQLKPELVEAHNNMAALAAARDQFADAAGWWQRTVALKPDYAEAHNNLGTALDRQDKLDEAEAAIRRAVELKPDFASAHYNLGAVLIKQQRFEEAAAEFRRALALDPNLAEAHHSLTVALTSLAQFSAALPHHRRAIALRPDYAEAHGALGGTLLMLGQFDEGWPQYEWRWKLRGMQLRHAAHPRWDGTPLAGRTILLHCEQAHGDTLQFIRYAELVKRQGGRVFVQCPPALERLLARCPGVDEVVSGEQVPPFDVQLPLLSLPGIFRTTLETIPNHVPYLFPDDELVARWRNDLAAERGFKIGVNWQGNPTQAKDRFRSFPLTWFAEIAKLEGVRLYSLQIGPGREQLAASPELPVVDLGDRLGDFHNTAAIVRNLDLVITCDSAPAHLAGGLGVPVWVPLPLAPDWRWLLERDDSPWYPTMRLFRQPRLGDWETVFQNIRRELNGALRAATPPG